MGKIPWRRAWQPTPAFLPGESQGQRSLTGYSPWGRKELDTTERLSTHMCILNPGPSWQLPRSLKICWLDNSTSLFKTLQRPSVTLWIKPALPSVPHRAPVSAFCPLFQSPLLSHLTCSPCPMHWPSVAQIYQAFSLSEPFTHSEHIYKSPSMCHTLSLALSLVGNKIQTNHCPWEVYILVRADRL